MPKRMYLTIGLPGSGKSTWAKYMARHDHNLFIVSADAIRTMTRGYYLYNKDLEPTISYLSYSMTRDLLQLGKSVIVDECNLTSQSRLEYVELARDQEAEVIYVEFTTDVETCKLRRITTKERGLDNGTWDLVIEKLSTIKEMTLPAEGYNKKFYVNEQGHQWESKIY